MLTELVINYLWILQSKTKINVISDPFFFFYEKNIPDFNPMEGADEVKIDVHKNIKNLSCKFSVQVLFRFSCLFSFIESLSTHRSI